VPRPLDPAAWRDAIARLDVDDARLAVAAAWAASFSWDGVAGEFVKLFDQLAATP
jgi:hypothetical protein